MNSIAKVFLIVLIVLLALLILVLVFAGLSYKKNKVSHSSKFLTALLSFLVFIFLVLTPLVHFNKIPVTLKYGKFANMLSDGSRLDIHFDSYEEYTYSTSNIQKGHYRLEKDTLYLYYKNGNLYKAYVVKGWGTDLYEDDILVYRYLR